MNLPALPTMDMVLDSAKKFKNQLAKPVTKETLFYHYLPLLGVKSYLELSLAVANPSLIESVYRSLGPLPDLTTVNTVTASSCLALYLYNRPTFSGSSLQTRGAYSIYYSSLFVLGSVLAWAIFARSMTATPGIRTLVIVGSSAGMLKITKSSLDKIDSRMGHPLGKK